MNKSQELWWEQAKSDHETFVLLRKHSIGQCHSLHYLQMVTEKISKAYLWRSSTPPRKSHVGFGKFLRLLLHVQNNTDRERIANLFGFKNVRGFQQAINWVLPIAYALERLAPNLANDGPNPEYPWPHKQPQYAPANYKFQQWAELMSSPGRQLMKVIESAVIRFPEYADT